MPLQGSHLPIYGNRQRRKSLKMLPQNIVKLLKYDALTGTVTSTRIKIITQDYPVGTEKYERVCLYKMQAYKHRVIFQILGIPLGNSVIHHINHDGTDNRRKNLQIMERSEHAKLHAKHRALLDGKPKRAAISTAPKQTQLRL